MKQLVNNASYIDVIESNGNAVSLSKSSLKAATLTNGAVFLNMLDDLSYFLNHREIENPATPGVTYASALDLYTDVLDYLYT